MKKIREIQNWLSFYFSADQRLTLCCSQVWFEQGSGSEHTEGTTKRGKDATTISSVHLDVAQDLCMGGRERYVWEEKERENRENYSIYCSWTHIWLLSLKFEYSWLHVAGIVCFHGFKGECKVSWQSSQLITLGLKTTILDIIQK